jgi:(p)ppGpp synthase/HD superfamily hydrolase
MKLTERQEKVLGFVKEQHGDQKRKYGGAPYWTHVYSVAERVAELAPEGVEIALCHDLLEDTACTYEQLLELLQQIGYARDHALQIVDGVQELTDVFIKEDYPDLNRKERKRREAERLSCISPLAQTVKYADLIDNGLSVVHHKASFARTYLLEKVEILNGMRAGNIHLLIAACHTVKSGLNALGLDTQGRALASA